MPIYDISTRIKNWRNQMRKDSDHAVTVRQALVTDLEAVIPLFDAYRQFYGKPSELQMARQFLFERFQHEQSVILIALAQDGAVLGFTQLYPSFSSVAVSRLFILNDLFVVPSARRLGVGARLLRAAAEFARDMGAVRLTLSTATTNEAAQALYETEGWVRSCDYYVYNLPIKA